MGNRANFVVVENGQRQLYYAHWAGCRMLDALIGGPELALRYIARQRRCDDEWLDEVWADGGALIDLDRRRLLFFGDELMTGIPERRAMLGILPELWPGYRVDWAYRGVAELAEYVGHQLQPPYRASAEQAVKLAKGRKSLCHLVSVVGGDGVTRLWPLWWGRSAIWHGPKLLDELPGAGQSRIRLGVIPESGVHVELTDKKLGMWTTRETSDFRLVVPELWAGWELENWGDLYEEQVARCGGAVRVPEVDLSAALDTARDWLQQRIFQSFDDSPQGAIVKLAGMLSGLAPGLEVSADAVGGSGVRPTPQQWEWFVQTCEQAKAIYTCSA